MADGEVDIDEVRADGIDIQVLIIKEIEKRAPLYRKDLKEYSDVVLKKRLWGEVCERLFPETWENMTEQQQRITGVDVLKRWKNIRACLARELRTQKCDARSGHAASAKRKRYLYYDLLLFLIPYMDHRPTGSPNTLSVQEEEEIEIIETVPRSRRSKRNRAWQESTDHIPKDKKVGREEEVDQDTHFALSLVPMLKKLSGDDKLDAQIQILQVFKSIKKRTSPVSPPGTFRSPSKKFRKTHRSS